MSKNPLPVMLFGHTRYKKLKKTLPLSRNRHVKLSWNRKNPHRQRGFGPVSSSLGRCMLNIHAYVLNIHACSTYIHTYMLNIHAYIHTYSTHARHTYVSMYVCMYAKLVCMYVRASGSTPPHKSQKIELSFKYWTFFVRNWTHPLGR